MDFSLYLAALIMGLVGSLHCLGICGGISVAFTQGMEPNKALRLTFTYQFFRIISYGLLGGLVASLGYQFTRWTEFPILPLLSGILLIMLGLYLLKIGNLLTFLEKIGHRLWRKLSPMQKQLLPIKNYQQAMGIGLLWGFLPCGLVYSALALATTSGSALEGFIALLCFGLGTLPAMLTLGIFSRQLLALRQKTWLQTLFAIIFISWGLFYLYSTLTNTHDQHGQHQEQNNQQHEKHQH